MLQYSHAGFLSQYESDLVLHIEAGVVEQSWIIDNRPGFEARKKLSEERASLFSKIYESDATEFAGKDSPSKAVTIYSAKHGNKLSEAIHHAIMQHFAQNYDPSIAGSEQDRTLRVEYENAIKLVNQARMVASTLLGIQKRGQEFSQMGIGEFFDIINFDLESLKHADDVLSSIRLPREGYARWAEANLRDMDKLVARGDFKLLGFCCGVLWALADG